MGDGTREDRTIYVRNIDNKVTEEILYDLFLQAGPLVSVKRPKDPDGNSRPFAFVEFEHDISPPYARSLMDGIKLFKRSISVQFRSGSRHSQDSRGNSPSATPPYSNGTQSPAHNGSQNFLTPPMVQRSLSAPQGFLGASGQGFGHPMGMQGAGYLPPPILPAPLMGNYPVSGFAQGILGPRPGLMMQQAPGRHADQQPAQQLPGHADSPHRHHHHHRQAHKEHRRSDEEHGPQSHHRDRHGNGNSGRHSDHYHSDRGHHSEERVMRHGNKHHHHHHRRDHPYRR